MFFRQLKAFECWTTSDISRWFQIVRLTINNNRLKVHSNTTMKEYTTLTTPTSRNNNSKGFIFNRPPTKEELF